MFDVPPYDCDITDDDELYCDGDVMEVVIDVMDADMPAMKLLGDVMLPMYGGDVMNCGDDINRAGLGDDDESDILLLSGDRDVSNPPKLG